MRAKTRRWLPIALCCLPGVAIAVIAGFGFAASGTAAGASSGWVALAMLACPLGMGLMMLMMRRGSDQNSMHEESHSHMMADCCAPVEQSAPIESDRLVALRMRRKALEHEITELQAGKGGDPA